MGSSYTPSSFPQQTTTSQISNQTQSQYSTANTSQQPQSSHPHQAQTSQQAPVETILRFVFLFF